MTEQGVADELQRLSFSTGQMRTAWPRPSKHCFIKHRWKQEYSIEIKWPWYHDIITNKWLAASLLTHDCDKITCDFHHSESYPRHWLDKPSSCRHRYMVQWLRTGTQRQHEEKLLQYTTSYSLNETEEIEIMTLSDVYSSHRMLLLGHHSIWEVLRKSTRWRQTARRHKAYQPTWKSDHFSLGHDDKEYRYQKPW